MSVKQDRQKGLIADLTIERAEVLAAVERAATAGKYNHFQATGTGAIVSVNDKSIAALAVGSKKEIRGATIDVALTEADDRIHLDSSIAKFRTTQSVVLGFIPAGPKSILCKGYIFKFFDALENELRAADPAASVSRKIPVK